MVHYCAKERIRLTVISCTAAFSAGRHGVQLGCCQPKSSLFSILPTAGTRLYGTKDMAPNEKRPTLLRSTSHQSLNSDLTLPHVNSSLVKQTSGNKHESCGSSGTWTRRTSGTNLLLLPRLHQAHVLIHSLWDIKP